MSVLQMLVTVAITAAVTLGIRSLAFLLFPGGKKIPAFILWLGKQLPCAVIAMLVVYCLKDVRFSSVSDWLPAIAGVAAAAFLHLWKHSTILSVSGATALYMVLIRIL